MILGGHISIHYTTLGMDLFMKINWPVNISKHLYTPWQKHSVYTKYIKKEIEYNCQKLKPIKETYLLYMSIK